MHKTILVPHAGTSAGDEALKHTIHAAKDTSVQIIILHIVEEIQHPRSFGLSESERENMFNSIRRQTRTLEKIWKKKWRKDCSNANTATLNLKSRLQ